MLSDDTRDFLFIPHPTPSPNRRGGGVRKNRFHDVMIVNNFGVSPKKAINDIS